MGDDSKDGAALRSRPADPVGEPRDVSDVPPASAYRTRGDLLRDQREALEELDRRTWGWRRMLPGAAWMVGTPLASLILARAVTDEMWSDSVIAFALVTVVTVLVVVRGLARSWRTVRETARDAAAVEQWRDLDRTLEARGLPAGDLDDLATAWDRRNDAGLDQAARDQAFFFQQQVLAIATRASLLMTVPFAVGIVAVLALVLRGDPGEAIFGAVGTLTGLLGAGTILTLAFREGYRRQRAHLVRSLDREVLLARRAVLTGEETAPQVAAGRRLLPAASVLFVVVAAAFVSRATTASSTVWATVGVLLGLGAAMGAIALWRSHQPRVLALHSGDPVRLGVGRHHRVEVDRTPDGTIRLLPRQSLLASAELPAASVRGIAPWGHARTGAPAGVVVVTEPDTAGHPTDVWAVTGRGVRGALPPTLETHRGVP